MGNLRIIARLDIKGANLIKGVHLEGVRKLGDPQVFARRYYQAGIDELIYMDAVASLYKRDSFLDIVRHTARNVFIPLTVGGGIRSVEDVRNLLLAGADKVALNTAATKEPQLITQISKRFGAQCTVLSIEAKRRNSGGWEAYTDNGREHTGLDVVDWARRGVELGAGEILLTSVDQEGTGRGFDLKLVKEVSNAVTVPVIASGGMGKLKHLVDVAEEAQADAVAIAQTLHYERLQLADIRAHALENGLSVRAL